MRPDNVSIDNRQQSPVLEEFDRSPKCRPRDYVACTRLAESLGLSPGCHLCSNFRLAGDLGGFRVNIAIITPETEETDRYLGLARSQAKSDPEAVPDDVEFLQEGLR